MGLCGRSVEPSARLPALTALKLRLCKSEASALAQSQTRLLWHVEQLLVCLGLSCHFPLQQQTLFYQTMYLESWDHFWRIQNNGPAGCRVVTHHFSLSTVETLLSHRNSSGPALAPLPPSFWFLWNRNIEKKICRKCMHIQVSHRHPSLSERGATRLPQSKNGWWASLLQQDVCTVFNQGLVLHEHDCTDTLLRALTVRMLCEIKTNQFPGKKTGLQNSLLGGLFIMQPQVLLSKCVFLFSFKRWCLKMHGASFGTSGNRREGSYSKSIIYGNFWKTPLHHI